MRFRPTTSAPRVPALAAILTLPLLLILLETPLRGQSDGGKTGVELRGVLPVMEKDSRIVERIVAWVNDEPLTLTEVEEALFRYQNGGLIERGRMSETRLRRALERLVDDKLILQAAKKREIKVAAETVDNRVDAMLQKIQEREGGKKPLETLLAKTGQTRAKLRDKLRAQVRDEMTVAQAVGSQLVLTASDVEEFETERRSRGLPTVRYDLAHLFIPVAADATEDRWDQAIVSAHQVRLEAGKKGDFAKIAADWASGHAKMGAVGGELGLVTVRELQAELALQLPTLQVGSSGPPVRSKKGVHLLYLNRKITARQILFAIRYEEKRAKWVKEMRRSASIQTIDSLLGDKN